MKRQLLHTMFIAKYGSMVLYDIDLEIIFIIDHEKLQFDKNTGLKFIVNPEEPDASLLDHEYFFVQDYLFDRTQSTHKDKTFIFKFISDNISFQITCI